jgi:hypothetical protein
MAMILASAAKSMALDQCLKGRQGAYLPAHVTLAAILAGEGRRMHSDRFRRAEGLRAAIAPPPSTR